MIIVKIIGGLGNQMFQYAYARKLQTSGLEVKLDISSFETYKLHGGYGLDKYRVGIDLATKEEVEHLLGKGLTKFFKSRFSFLSRNLLKEQTLLFDHSLLFLKDSRYVEGYFQSEKYFFDIKDILFDDFRLKQQPSDYTLEIEEIISNCEQSVSVHIRRGDYVADKKTRAIHGSCPIEYYKDAIRIFANKKSHTSFFVFSDDIEWVKKTLMIPNAIYVDKPGRIPHEDIYLMSLCQHNIVANSSFSWWGAWLNRNDEKIVIAPKRWFADNSLQIQARNIIPETWMKL